MNLPDRQLEFIVYIQINHSTCPIFDIHSYLFNKDTHTESLKNRILINNFWYNCKDGGRTDDSKVSLTIAEKFWHISVLNEESFSQPYFKRQRLQEGFLTNCRRVLYCSVMNSSSWLLLSSCIIFNLIPLGMRFLTLGFPFINIFPYQLPNPLPNPSSWLILLLWYFHTLICFR